MAVGSYTYRSRPHGTHVELMTMACSTWATKADYPYHREISHYPMATFDEHFIVFGGYDGGYNKPTIAKFSPRMNKWTKLGDLRSARGSHGVARIGNQFLVIGGNNGPLSTESCTLKGDSMNCIIRAPLLETFSVFPELFMIPSSYTDQCKNGETLAMHQFSSVIFRLNEPGGS